VCVTATVIEHFLAYRSSSLWCGWLDENLYTYRTTSTTTTTQFDADMTDAWGNRCDSGERRKYREMNADEPPPTIPSPAGRGPAVLLLSGYPQAVGVASGGGTGVQRVLTPSVRPSCWAARVDDYQTVKTVSEQASDKWKIAACATIRSERKHRLVRRNLLVTHLTIVSRHNATLTMTRHRCRPIST